MIAKLGWGRGGVGRSEDITYVILPQPGQIPSPTLLTVHKPASKRQEYYHPSASRFSFLSIPLFVGPSALPGNILGPGSGWANRQELVITAPKENENWMGCYERKRGIG